MVQSVAAMSPAQVGPPRWSPTTRISSRPRPTESMVRTKFRPCAEKTQAVRRMAWSGLAAATSRSPRELARAVDVERAGVVVLAPGAAGGAVEDVVGGEVQERQPARGGGGGHGAGGGGVDRLGQRRLVLGAVDLGVGGGVDDDVGVGGADRAGAGLGVGEVGRRAPEEGRLDAARRGRARQLAGDLPGLAEDQRPHQPVRRAANPHAFTPYSKGDTQSRKAGWPRSLSDRTTAAAGRPQSMPRSASLQSTPPSLAAS